MKYANEQLCFSRAARCKCGEGLAYPNDGDVRGSWSCSAILRGDAVQDEAHDMVRPFMFWNVKSEHETPGRKETTRPGGFIERKQLVYCGPAPTHQKCPTCDGSGRVPI